MPDMIYISEKGNRIVFDDFADDTKEYGIYWGNMCPHCRNKYSGILENRVSSGGSDEGICSVKGCKNNACYYVDFKMNEVIFAD